MTNQILCSQRREVFPNTLPCELSCRETVELPSNVILKSVSFWIFVMLLSIGTILFNVINSMSDAVCFDVIGDKYDYGKQRMWGSVGYGTTALLSGFAMDYLCFDVSGLQISIYIMLLFTALDLTSCVYLRLPIIPAPENLWKDLKTLMKYNTVMIFLVFTVIAGTADGFVTYFLLWYVEDLASETGIKNVKIIEGTIVAAGTFGGVILFFYIGDNVLKKLGHVKCFSFCFLCYAVRLWLTSIVASPWHIVGINFLLEGPTYALTYLTIVAYANEISPPGASATIQGIAAGLDDGLGYSIGSLCGGVLYQYVGARRTFELFAFMCLLAGILHYSLNFSTEANKKQEPQEIIFMEVPTEEKNI